MPPGSWETVKDAGGIVSHVGHRSQPQRLGPDVFSSLKHLLIVVGLRPKALIVPKYILKFYLGRLFPRGFKADGRHSVSFSGRACSSGMCPTHQHGLTRWLNNNTLTLIRITTERWLRDGSVIKAFALQT